MRFATAVTGSAATAEDVMQETFLAAYRHAGDFRGDASVKSWLMTITFRQALKSGRKRSGEPKEMEPLDALGAAAGWGAEEDPAAALDRHEGRAMLRTAMEGLSEEDRTMLVLRDLEGLSGKEVAQALDLSLAAVKSRLHRSRLHLAAALRRLGYQHGA
ncbi:MAG: RNA polymerase sigma factor [Deltaproteobacteria bacterium]|nr:RNA polymerase sigma factor [Deltaproteobacteria bacterium]